VKTMSSEPGPVSVIAEAMEGRVGAVSLELVGHARTLADQLGAPVEAVLLGEGLDGQAQQLIAAGADTVYLGDDTDLAVYHPELYTEIVVTLAEEKRPDIVLMGSTPMGRQLPALVAARLGTGLTAS
jgi:electron transfer flavoprotein alpha subunit